MLDFRSTFLYSAKFNNKNNIKKACYINISCIPLKNFKFFAKSKVFPHFSF